MTLWLILLLVWTTGIPVAVFLVAAAAAHMRERRLARLLPVLEEWRLVAPRRCERRRRAHAAAAVRARRPV